jgi:Xaa-Pro aminopeptidase
MNERLTRLRAEMERRGLDAVWITSAENHLYFSLFDNPDGWMLITRTKAYVFADFRYIEAARREASPDCTVIEPPRRRTDYLPPLIEEENVRVIGYEDERLSCRALASLEEDLPQCTFVPLGRLCIELRTVKTEAEVEHIVAAQRIAEDALAAVLALIRPEMTELEVAAELEYQMKKRGSRKPSFDTIAVSGSASSSPHGVPRPCPLERGFLTMDFGAMVDGYHSDMTRTVVIGRADTEMKRLYRTVLDAQLAALAALRPGARNADMDKIARDLIDGAGYAGCFGHSLGHGVGLEIHEAPNLSAFSGDLTLRPGEIVTVEPGIYLEGKYGCRIEDMACITEDGYRNLTAAPKELTEIL